MMIYIEISETFVDLRSLKYFFSLLNTGVKNFVYLAFYRSIVTYSLYIYDKGRNWHDLSINLLY